MKIKKGKYVEEIIEIEGDTFTEVTDKVKEYMEEGYKPIIVQRKKHDEYRWVGGAIKRTKVE